MRVTQLIEQVEKLRACEGGRFTDPEDQKKFMGELAQLKQATLSSVRQILSLQQSKPYRTELLTFGDMLANNGRLTMLTDIKLILELIELEAGTDSDAWNLHCKSNPITKIYTHKDRGKAWLSDHPEDQRTLEQVIKASKNWQTKLNSR